MAAHRYKQFLRVIENWPLDATKGKQRDLGALLRDRFAAEFKQGELSEIRDPEKCNKMLTSLENIVNDRHKMYYRCDLEKGALGGDMETAHLAVSDEVLNSLKSQRSPLLSGVGFLGEKDKDKDE